jgi:hypothetical protein
MAEAATASPPAAPAASSPAPSAPPPPPSASPDIHVTPAEVDRGPKQPEPRKGSAREKLFDDLRRKARPTNAPEEKEEPELKGSPASGSPGEQPPKEGSEVSPEPPAATEAGAAVSAEAKKKVSPWKLVEEYKARLATLEKEVADAKTTRLDPKEKEDLTTRLSAAEKRAQDLDEHIKYVDYTKSREFAEKYQKPYEEAWKKAMGELGELVIDDPTSPNGSRPITPDDLLELVNMPLQKARELANATYGDFADDVMTHRKEIKNLFEAQQKGLAEARKLGLDRTKKIQEFQQHITKTIVDHWNKANQEVVADEKLARFFKPVAGDEESAKRLERGYKLSDKAFAVDSRDPRLTPQQREDAVRTHAAVRNRAAAFGHAVYLLEKAEAEVKSLKAELDKYRSTEPGQGEGTRPVSAAPSSARDSVFGALRKYAH